MNSVWRDYNNDENGVLVKVQKPTIDGYIDYFIGIANTTVITVVAWCLFWFWNFDHFIMAIFSIKKMFKKKLKPNYSVQLDEEKYPVLFEMLYQTLRDYKLKTKLQVILIRDMGPSIEVKGIFRKKAKLYLGIYDLLLQDKEQLRSIICHEIGHVIHSSTFWAGLYNRLLSFARLSDRYFHSHASERFSVRYYRRISKRIAKLNRFRAKIIRYNEYLTDKIASKKAGEENFKEALMSHSLRQYWLYKVFFPHFTKRQNRERNPSNYFRLMQRIAKRVSWSMVEEKHSEAVSAGVTKDNDTHFSLIDRVKMLGKPPIIKNKLDVSAFEAYILDDSILDFFYKQFFFDSFPSWQREYKKIQDYKHVKDKDEIDFDEAKLCAEVAKNLDLKEDAVKFYEKAYHLNNNHAGVNYQLAHYYSDNNPRKTLEHSIKVLENDASLGLRICDWLLPILISNDIDSTTIHSFNQARQRCADIYKQSIEERQVIHYKDKYYPVEDEELVSFFKEFLHEKQLTGNYYLVRREVTYLPQYPLYVLLLPNEKSTYSATTLIELRQIPEDGRLFLLYRNKKRTTKLIRAIEGVDGANFTIQ